LFFTYFEIAQDERIIQLLEEIRSEQASQKILLMNILRKMGSMENADAELPEGLELPLKSHQELYNFESRLEDPTVAKGLVSLIDVWSILIALVINLVDIREQG